jgi:hypothetical protein
MEPITDAEPITDIRTDVVDAALAAGRPTGAIELPDHPITDMEAHPLDTTTMGAASVTEKLTELGQKATRELKLARDVKDSIGPKAKEFDALKADAKAKMTKRMDEHLERAKVALIEARELMKAENLGPFDAWIRSGAVIGLSGKPIGRAQVYRLIDGRSAGNVDKATGKRTPASPTGDCRRQAAPPDDLDFVEEPKQTPAGKPTPATAAAFQKWLEQQAAPLEPGCCTFHDTGGSLDLSCGHCNMGGVRREEKAAAAPSKPANEPQATPADVLLDTFHKLTPKEQVSAMQLFWDVLSPSQRQQIAPKHEASEDHPSAAPTMEQFEAFWESASRDLRKAVNTFVQKKAAEARARQQATMRPMTSAEQNRP